MEIKTYVAQLKNANRDDYQHLSRQERMEVIDDIHEKLLNDFIVWIKSFDWGENVKEANRLIGTATIVLKFPENILEEIEKYSEIAWIKENVIAARIN